MPQVETTEIRSVTIPDGQTVSGAASLEGDTLVGLILDAALDSTSLSFQVSDAVGGTYLALYDDAGNAIAATVAASRAVSLAPAEFSGWRFIKVVGGSAQSGADTIIKLVTRPVA